METIGRIRNGTRKGQPDAIREELERVGRQTTKVLTAAEEAAHALRAEAEQDAKKVRQDAEAEAARVIEKAVARRREIEKVVADLEARREAVVKGLQRLANELAGAATEGKMLNESPANGSPPARPQAVPSK